jgi:hypothetical protein
MHICVQTRKEFDASGVDGQPCAHLLAQRAASSALRLWRFAAFNCIIEG